MRKFIFLSAEGETIAPNENIEVNNLQVIGIVENVNTEDEALKALLKENPWIWESGFNPDEFVVHQLN